MFTKVRLWMAGYWVGLIGCFSGLIIAARTDGMIGGGVILGGLVISGVMRLVGKRPRSSMEDGEAQIEEDRQGIIKENQELFDELAKH